MVMKTFRDLYSPSGLNSTFSYTGSSFSGYVNWMREIIETARVDLTEDNYELLIDVNSPFEWYPHVQGNSQYSSPRLKRGILLIHGLFDSPCSMLSLAEHFRKQQYLVRALLLPGHGTVPGDLLHINFQEWLKATRFGIQSFLDEVEELYLCGFSTGAALCLHQALTEPVKNLKGLILLAPAIQLQRQFAIISNINNVIRKTIGGVHWFIKTESSDYAKYQSYTYNSAHQVYLLTRNNKFWLGKKNLDIPIFMVATTDDEMLSYTSIVNFFSSTQQEKNHLIIYTTHELTFTDPRIEIRQSAYPEQRILNFSHIAIPVAPDHFHYGREGDYQDFEHYDYPIGQRLKRHLEKNRNQEVHYGAINAKALQKYHLQRLTYNPDFNYMIGRIDEFIDAVNSD